MRQLLFNLQNVPEDEAEDIRQILYDNSIVFYETQAGRWRIGLAGIWLPDGSQKAEAQALIEQYQASRYEEAAYARDQLREQGLLNAFVQNLYMEPLKVSAALLGIAVVLAISILPFVL